MKGFIFSIEALAAISIVMLALGIFAYSASLSQEKTNNTQIQSQADKQMMLYFNETANTPNPTAKEQYCTKIVYCVASSPTPILDYKTYCEVPK